MHGVLEEYYIFKKRILEGYRAQLIASWCRHFFLKRTSYQSHWDSEDDILDCSRFEIYTVY